MLKEISIKKVKGRESLLRKQEDEAVGFIKKYHVEIVNKWTQFFIQNKKLVVS